MSKNEQVKILGGCECRKCGYPIVFALSNPPFNNFKDSAEFDYWYYCSNKSCDNHGGEGGYSCANVPEFVKGCQ